MLYDPSRFICDAVTEFAPDDTGERWRHPRLWTPEDIHNLVMEEVGSDEISARGYAILIKLYQPPRTTDYGLEITDHASKKVTTQCTIGKVLRMGYEAFRDPVRFPFGYRVTYGEWALFRGSERQQIGVGDARVAIVNEDRFHSAGKNPNNLITAFELEHEWANG